MSSKFDLAGPLWVLPIGATDVVKFVDSKVPGWATDVVSTVEADTVAVVVNASKGDGVDDDDAEDWVGLESVPKRSTNKFSEVLVFPGRKSIIKDGCSKDSKNDKDSTKWL